MKNVMSNFRRLFEACNLGGNCSNSSPGHQDLFLPIGHNWRCAAVLLAKKTRSNLNKTEETFSPLKRAGSLSLKAVYNIYLV